MKIVVSKSLRDFAANSKQYIPVVLGVLGVIALIGAITWALWPKTLVARVDTISWYYVVQLQQKTILHDAEWGKPWNREVVNGSMKCARKYYGMKDCHCRTDYYYTGYGENRTRHSRRKCDRCQDYRDWCEYDYITWPKVKEWSSSGNTFLTNWPEYPKPNENQRITRTEFYNVIFADPSENKKYTFHPKSLNEFKQYPNGSKWTVKVFVNNGVDVLHEN